MLAALMLMLPSVAVTRAASVVRARARIRTYRTTASVEGGVAGAGGFVLAAADFPALMAIKVRMLGDVVGAYGWGGDTVRERLFLLHIFHLAFASAKRRPEALAELERWIAGVDQPEAITEYDWRRFQIEYRDYIDLAKLAQLIPVVGATIAAFLVAIVMIFVNFPVALVIWVVFAIAYQQFENYVIQPQIQKRATEIDPFLVLVAVLFGSTLFGVMGAILAIPAAASPLPSSSSAWRWPPGPAGGSGSRTRSSPG